MTKKKVHRRTKVSASTNRKNMKRPEKAPKISRFAETPVEQAAVGQTAIAEQVPVQIVKTQPTEPQVDYSNLTLDMMKVNTRMQRRAEKRAQQPMQTTMSAQEIKEQEIKKAISATNRSLAKQKKVRRHYKKMDFGFRRVLLAMASAAAAVCAIVYFVNVNSPDIPIKVAAMQTGIDAHYPGYIPRDFSLSDITSENGKITMNFKNSASGDAFSLVEEKTDWNADDLYTNFVRGSYGDNYVVVNENGANVYISGSNAAWVSEGIFYKITTTAGSLTKKQISTIAAKL